MDEGKPDEIVLRFVHHTQVKHNPDGTVRVGSNAFYNPKDRMASVFFRDGVDVEAGLRVFAGYGIAEISRQSLELQGFIVERSPPEGELMGDHADVRPSIEWSDSRYLRECKKLALMARLVLMPEPPQR